MKLEMDLVRDILLAVEASTSPSLSQLFILLGKGYQTFTDPVCYHLKMLIEQAHFLSAIDSKSMGGPDWFDFELTWSGHEFLNTIRDTEVWSLTKTGVEKAGGFSFDLVAALAKGYIKTKIEYQTGVKLDL